MRKKNCRKKRNLQEIAALVGELEASNLNVTGLAKREGVSVGAVYQWKKRVQQRCPQPVEPIELVGPTNNELLAPLTTSGITLTLNEIECRVQPNFDQETLIRVIEAINKNTHR